MNHTNSAEGGEVFVRHRASEFSDQPATLAGDVLYTDYPDKYSLALRRSFWLLDHQVQLVYEPFSWRHEWYVDMVEISVHSANRTTIYSVRDMEIDIVVEGMGPTYRIIDLDVFGGRVSVGEFSATECRDVLLRTQHFLDTFLHRGAGWPPREILPFFAPDHAYPI